MPTSRKPKSAQHDPRIIVPNRYTSTSANSASAADEQRHALQMSMDTRQ